MQNAERRSACNSKLNIIMENEKRNSILKLIYSLDLFDSLIRYILLNGKNKKKCRHTDVDDDERTFIKIESTQIACEIRSNHQSVCSIRKKKKNSVD